MHKHIEAQPQDPKMNSLGDSRGMNSNERFCKSAFQDFMRIHNTEIKALKGEQKVSSDKKKKLTSCLLRMTEEAQNLEEKISKRNDEIENNCAEITRIKQENEMLQSQLLLFNRINVELEKNYEYKLETMQLNERQLVAEEEQRQKILRELQEKYANLELKSIAVIDDVAKKSELLIEVKEKEALLHGTFRQVKIQHQQYIGEKMKEHNDTIKELKKQLTVVKKQLEEKNDAIELCRREKEELENSKNLIIAEKSYRIREIERVFNMPDKTPFGKATKPTQHRTHKRKQVELPDVSGPSTSFQGMGKRIYQVRYKTNESNETTPKKQQKLNDSSAADAWSAKTKRPTAKYIISTPLVDKPTDDSAYFGALPPPAHVPMPEILSPISSLESSVDQLYVSETSVSNV